MTDDLKNRADACGVPYLPEILPGHFDASLIEGLPVTWAREHVVLPIRFEGTAALALEGPEALSSLPQAVLAIGCDLSPVFAPREEILRGIDAAYFQGKKTESAPAPAAPARPAPAMSATTGEDLLVDRGNPVESFVNNMLLRAIRENASDVHVEPVADGSTRVRFRLSGQLYDRPGPAAGLGEQVVSRVKVMAGMDIAEHRLPQDGMAQVRTGGRAVDVRVSTIPVADGERIVMRLLNRDDSLLPLAELGMPEDVLADFSALLESPNGIVVVSGPTGSGKTTTLYSALGSLNASRRNIMTIEDPVEYRLPNIAQIQVKPKIGLTFANGLRHILRQDPDVVLVGETRDAETAEIAVRASLTGHLVFTTLHTNDAPSAVMRLVDMGIEPYLIASSLRGVLAQRLVRRACPFCARHEAFGTAGLGRSEEEIARKAGCADVLRASHCDRCLEGYDGRIGVFELLRCSVPVADAIHAGRFTASDLRSAAGEGYRPMLSDLYGKLRAGITTPAEALSIFA